MSNPSKKRHTTQRIKFSTLLFVKLYTSFPFIVIFYSYIFIFSLSCAKSCPDKNRDKKRIHFQFDVFLTSESYNKGRKSNAEEYIPGVCPNSQAQVSYKPAAL